MQISKRPPDSLFQLVTDMWTKPFWDAAAEGHLVAPRCGHCGRFRMPPTPFCPNCRSQTIDWVTLSGNGILFSYTIVTRAIFEGMEDSLPYVAAVVELPDAGGVRLITNIVDAPIDAIEIGMKLKAFFDERPSGVVIPRFKMMETPR
jgi:uncharacterized OB-fold protein